MSTIFAGQFVIDKYADLAENYLVNLKIENTILIAYHDCNHGGKPVH